MPGQLHPPLQEPVVSLRRKGCRVDGGPTRNCQLPSSGDSLAPGPVQEQLPRQADGQEVDDGIVDGVGQTRVPSPVGAP